MNGISQTENSLAAETSTDSVTACGEGLGIVSLDTGGCRSPEGFLLDHVCHGCAQEEKHQYLGECIGLHL